MRKSYYAQFKTLPKNAKLNPTDKTLQWEMALGKAIVKWAHEQGGETNHFRRFHSLPRKYGCGQHLNCLNIAVYRNSFRNEGPGSEGQRQRQKRERTREPISEVSARGQRISRSIKSPIRLLAFLVCVERQICALHAPV